MGKAVKKLPRTVSDSYMNQITVLKSLSAGNPGSSPDLRTLHIEEIAERSGLEDEKEVLRYLYILEGQKLVTPLPVGDFTSKTWQITREGLRALKMIDSATPAS